MTSTTANRGRLATGAVLALLLMLALAGSPPARAAAPSHAFLFSITGTVPPPPPPTPPFDYSPDRYFEDACGAAVDSQGNVYIADYFHHAVDVYNDERIFITRIPNLDPADGPCGLAIDSSGSLYVNYWRRGVARLTPSEFPYPYCEPVGKFPAGSLCPPPGERTGPAPTYTEAVLDMNRSTGVAVDPSSGDVFVDDRSYVAVYDDTGAPVKVGGQPLRIGLGSGPDGLEDAYGGAVSDFAATDGYVYVPDAAAGVVKVYDPATDPSHPVQIIDGAGTPQGGFHSLLDASIAIDQSNGHVFVVDNLQSPFELAAAVVDEFAPSGAYRGQLPHALLAAEPSGLTVDEEGKVYVTSGNTEGSVLYAFGPTEPASSLDVTTTGAGAGTVKSGPAGISCGSACSAEYNVGEQVTLEATADVHSTFTGWTVAGSPGACPGTGPCKLTLNANTAVSADFAANPQRTLTVAKTGTGTGEVSSEPARISCGSACSAEYNVGEQVTLEATADVHSTFTGWTVAGSPGACPGTGPCKLTLNANTAVSVDFAAIPQRTLTVAKTGTGKGMLTSEPAGIDCEAACLVESAEFNVGEEVTLNAAPGAHSTFTGWTVAGSPGACPGTGPCSLTLDADTEVSADFASIPQKTLAVHSVGTGVGTISSSPAGIECGAACAQSYDQGTPLTLIARATPGSRFVGWSGAGCAGTGACRVVLAADAQVSAAFERIQHGVSVALTGPGAGTVSSSPAGIDCGSSCVKSYDQGTVLTLTGHPSRGSAFLGWSGCDSQNGNRCTVAVNTYRPVIAAFEKSPPSSLELAKITSKGTAATLDVLVPHQGKLSASGKWLRPVEPVTVDAGEAKLRLRLSKAGVAALRGTRHRKLGVEVTVTFQPSGRGKVEVAKGSVTFRAKGKGPSAEGEAALAQKGDLFAAFSGAITPSALPRHTISPISVSVSGTVRTLSGERPPALRKISIALNRNGHIDARGLPSCRIEELESASTAGALEACGDALVGSGSYAAATAFPEQEPFPSRGRILAFNSRLHGQQVILAHVYGTNLAPITRVLVFHLRHTSGTFGTVLTAALPVSLNRYGYLERIHLELHRRFTYRGQPRSYLGAACPAPDGFSGAVFPFVHATMSFDDGRSLSSTLTRECKVQE
jgi:hypothetical protein